MHEALNNRNRAIKRS